MNDHTAMRAPLILATWSFGIAADRAGWRVLQSLDGRAIDAVEQACRAVEEDPAVDSVGYGGLPDRTGQVTLDGAIMTAPNRCGSVCAVKHCMYPVSLARRVMERTHHVMLAGGYADQFATEQGLHTDQELLTDRARESWEKWRAQSPDIHDNDRFRGWLPPKNVEELKGVDRVVDRASDDPERLPHNRVHDTVGVLALDRSGELASACSTSGMAFKVPGRVGDSPIIGHGLYCEPGVGCAVATGNGELIMGVCGSFLAVERLRIGDSPEEAARQVIRRTLESYDLEEQHQVAVLVMSARGEWSAAALRPGYRTAIMTEDRCEPELIDAQWVALPDPPARKNRDDRSML